MKFWTPALVFALAGCASLGLPTSEQRMVDEIIAETLSAARASPAERAAAVTRADQRHTDLQDEASRVRLAALLATLPAPQRDEARAAALLGPPAGTSPGTPLARLSALMAADLAERQKLARSGETLRRQLEDLKALDRAMLRREERVPSGIR